MKGFQEEGVFILGSLGTKGIEEDNILARKGDQMSHNHFVVKVRTPLIRNY